MKLIINRKRIYRFLCSIGIGCLTLFVIWGCAEKEKEPPPIPEVEAPVPLPFLNPKLPFLNPNLPFLNPNPSQRRQRNLSSAPFGLPC